MKRLIGLAMSLAVVAAAIFAFAPRPLPAFPASSLKPDRLQINGLARAGDRLVAVGERGKILVSDDSGAHWRPADVKPDAGSTLTQVAFADARVGVAVGHDGVIVRTDDGGLHWRQVHIDEAHSDPLLSVWGAPTGEWFALGSFGALLRSHDGGRTWQPSPQTPAADRHLNAMASDARHNLMIVGEAGTVLRSTDGGAQWAAVKSPYAGSLYGVLPLTDGAWVAYGMRGNVLRSEDFGTTWERVELPAAASFFGGAQLADGRIVLVGQGGTVAVSGDGGRHFTTAPGGGAMSLSAVLPMPSAAPGATSSNVLVAGDGGLTPLALPPR
ncbi:Ycf48-like protein [Pandoraea terrae]|uniref:Ycf48-like protein n=1 Tax=Pandoraea terrae TaxID=1537710 RepID=A0A5E4ZCK7_9BURK|nr:YCF48-related protein [Pandoraea terrae]VVE58407.1 Ycf48-like protein [Pandoraea terrae]